MMAFEESKLGKEEKEPETQEEIEEARKKRPKEKGHGWGGKE